ncbi:MAG TPA: alpha/beta hydrolase [Candidatus Hydrogenedens sp.]|nr:alpha/beta hydrolase [Candidatus Hydrogenedens sp.]
MKQFFLPINSSIRLSIYDFGGKGLPIIFCHFTGGLGKLWHSVITPLREKYHCFAFDARGHGDSSKPLELEWYDWNEHLSDLIAVIKYIRELTNSDCIFGVGHSFGSACLSQAVVKTQKYILWKRIALIEPILGPENFDFRKMKMSEIARKRRGYFESEEQIEAILRKKQPYKNWDNEAWNIYKKHGFINSKSCEYYLKCSPEIESYQYLYGNPSGWFERLKKINTPVLLIYGKNSELLPLSNYQLKQMKNAYLLKIPEVGHFFPQEKPSRLAEILKNWFS